MTSGKIHADETGRLDSRPVAFAVLLILLTLLAYMPVFQAGFIWDDDLFITDNFSLRSPEGLKVIWTRPAENPQYYPLLLTTLRGLFRVFGENPSGYHVVTLLFHVATALALWRLARRLVPAGAAWCALLFALHPIQVQSVAWATELKNTMSGFFYVAGLVCWISFLDRDGERERAGIPVSYWCAFVLFLAATLSKTTTFSWPLAAFLIAMYRDQAGGRLRLAAFLSPMAVIGALVGWISVAVEHSGYENGVPAILRFAEKWFVAARSLWFYAGKTLWPNPLMMIYPRWDPDVANPANILSLASAIPVLVVLFAARRRIGKGPFLGSVFYVVALGPIPFLGINFVYLYSYDADHFTYLPNACLFLVLGACISSAARFLDSGARKVIGVIIITGLCAATWRHAGTFQSEEALWKHNVRYFPESTIAWMNLGHAFSERGAYGEEIEAYEKVIALDPQFTAAYNDLGLAKAAAGDVEGALTAFRHAMTLDPELVEPKHNLANALAAQGHHDQAIKFFLEVLEEEPGHLHARLNLIHALRLKGRLGEAGEHADAVLKQAPPSAEAWYEAGRVDQARGDYERAARRFREALNIKSDYEEALSSLTEVNGVIRDQKDAGSVSPTPR
ncbi:MAG: tetratricopeptide repeat protein [Verrucomicrobia bacterium]|nr:tetratricopeptide repeat protein [Verrucomicrobiota bacterium]